MQKLSRKSKLNNNIVINDGNKLVTIKQPTL